ncbi:HNH endonuclease [Lentzea sp. NBRC 105346]|uniref:HNH endonuclease signature motif containing protein n=1 Tax=Lentzea sp. NBRC 105346 TaxID=3032205 RepID=UPI0024A0E107|nr:HNH endonuclease signature motif containing protein [Lentzea sp. NBRC 105346]GLZ29514.1 HNH endonuclease [Lentzea sp. NBRC 105346]
MVDTDLSLLSSGELLDGFAAMEREIRVRHERLLRWIAEMDRRGLAAELGYKDLVGVLKDRVHWDPSVSKAKLRRARLLSHRLGQSGAEIEPELPATAEALAEGELTEEHVDAIAKAMKNVPADATPDKTAFVERQLAEFGRTFEPGAIRDFGKKIIYRMFQNDEEPDEKDPAPPSDQLIARMERGRCRGSFDLGPEIGAKFLGALDPLAKPRPTGPDGPDTRTYAQRQGDAFAELINLVLRADVLPEHGGETVTMAVTVSYDDLKANVGDAVLDNQEHIPVKQLRKLACEAGVIPIVLGSRSQPLNVGRKARLFNSGLRRALVARDRGCAFPGCNRPPRHCEGHHITHWADGGKTSLHNGVLLCRRHHDLIHHSDWEVKLRNGIPYFIPPAFLDPLRQPRRNPLHMVS